MERATKVGVSGNSIVVRIQKELADFIGLQKGTLVKVYPLDNRKIIIEKA